MEDPGAANFAAGLVGPLQDEGARPLLFADGTGASQLRAWGLVPETGTAAPARLREAAALVVGVSENRQTLAHRLVDEARHSGLQSFGMVDGPSSNARHMFAGEADDPQAHAPDWLLLPASAARADFHAAGFDDERLIEAGTPHYARVLAHKAVLDAEGRDAVRRRLFPEVEDGRRIVIFLAELSDGLDPSAFRRSADYTLAGWGDDDRRTHVVLQEVLDALDATTPRPRVVLRLHPKNDAGEFARYARQIDRVSVNEPALDLTYGADLVIGMTSMLLAEAALLGQRVLSVLPRARELAWLPAEVGPHLPNVSTRADLGSTIEAGLSVEPAPDLRTLTDSMSGRTTEAAHFVAETARAVNIQRRLSV